MPANFPTSFFEQVSDPVLISDANGKILFKNKAALTLFEPAGKLTALGDILQEQSVRRALTARAMTIAENTVLRGASASEAWSLWIVPLQTESKNDVFILILDKSRQRKLSLSEREEALAAIAHDLKNPLGAIFGYADAMLDTAVGEGLNPKQREVVSRIRSTASRSIELVRNFQHLSQLDSIAETTVAGKCELNAAITAVVNYTWREDSERPTLKIKLAEKEMQVAIERLLLERIIGNLYGNALKFTPLDGHIEISSSPDGSFGKIEVRNNLPLISVEESEKIFKRYVRGSGSRGTAGSGLGLYIVQQILIKAGGSISVASSAETGTVFTVRIPLA